MPIYPFITWLGTTASSVVVSGAAILWAAKTQIGGKIFNGFFKYSLDKKLASSKHEHEEALAALKHSYEKELEKLKTLTAHLKDRSVRSNEKEYNAVIACWEQFIGAYYATLQAIGGLRMIPDLTTVNDDDIEPMLESMGIGVHDRASIIGATDKNKELRKVIRWMEINAAGMAIHDARDALRKRSIFLDAELENRFERALTELGSCWDEQKTLATLRGDGAVFPIPHSHGLIGSQGTELWQDLRDAVRESVYHKPQTSMRTV